MACGRGADIQAFDDPDPRRERRGGEAVDPPAPIMRDGASDFAGAAPDTTGRIGDNEPVHLQKTPYDIVVPLPAPWMAQGDGCADQFISMAPPDQGLPGPRSKPSKHARNFFRAY
jgi:hypothetical protein